MSHERLTSIHLICSCSLLLPVTIGGSQIEGWRKLHSDGGPEWIPQRGCLQGPPGPSQGPGSQAGPLLLTRRQGQGEPGGLTCCSQWACGCRAPRRWSRPRSSPHNSPASPPHASADPTARPPRSWCSGTRGHGQVPRAPLQRQAHRPSAIRARGHTRRPQPPHLQCWGLWRGLDNEDRVEKGAQEAPVSPRALSRNASLAPQERIPITESPAPASPGPDPLACSSSDTRAFLTVV